MKIGILTTIILYAFVPLAKLSAGIITGQITDHFTQQGIPYATVSIMNSTWGTATDADGKFQIDLLPPDTYQIKISAVGYSARIIADVRVNNSAPTQLNVSLQEEIIKLNDVTIKADYFSKSSAQFNSINSFGYEEIRRSAGGFEDVVRALSILPGVGQADAGRNDLIVRGGAPSENLFLVQGIEIPNINHFGTQGASGGPLSFINLDFVRETSFSTGGFPVSYGDRLSSVLTIDLRNGRTEKLGGKATISATQFGLNLEGPLTSSSSFLFSARRSYLDFIFKAAGFGFVPEYWDFMGKYDWTIDSKNTVSCFGIAALDNVKYFNSTEKQRFDNSRVLGSDQIQYISGISFRHLLNAGFVRIALSRNYIDYRTSQKDSLLRPLFLNESKEAENKIKVEYANKLSAVTEITAGGVFNFAPFEANIKLPSFITSFGERLPYDALRADRNYIKSALFFNVSSGWADQFSTITGIRVDYFDGLSSKFRLSPRIAIAYQPDMLWSFNLSAGLYHQAPSYIWLTAGNTGLKPVQMAQFIFGVEHRFNEDALIKLEGYIKKYNDYPASVLRPYITLANTGAGFAGAEENYSSFGLEPLASLGSGTSRGLELSAQKKLSSIPCYGIISLTWNKTEFIPVDGISRPGAYDQRWIFNLSGGYKFSQSLEASLKFRFASGRPYTPYNADGTQNRSDYNSARLPSSHSLDLRIDKHWFYESYTLITYIDIQNIYGRRNISAYRWNQRNKIVEANKGIGILPSIGLSLEF